MIFNSKKRRKELWEKDKTWIQKARINAGVFWRRFMVQTHGMGLIMVIFLVAIAISTGIPYITDAIQRNLDMTKYRDALINACKDSTFYAWNFKSCENVEARP